MTCLNLNLCCSRSKGGGDKIDDFVKSEDNTKVANTQTVVFIHMGTS